MTSTNNLPLNENNILRISNIQKSYNKRVIIRDVSFQVRRGEVVGILGPNGAGKTTSFYMVAGLIKPDKGSIYLNGQDVTHLPMYRRAQMGIGYLPQENSIFRGLTVEENILVSLQSIYKKKETQYEELQKLLDDFSINHIRKSPALSLSGGERRRVEIARALATKPSFMLLDEPFAGVDPIAVNDLRTLINKLIQKNIGVLITDHNVRETLSSTDRCYIIFNGTVLIEGTPEEIIKNEDVQKVYLGNNFQK